MIAVGGGRGSTVSCRRRPAVSYRRRPAVGRGRRPAVGCGRRLAVGACRVVTVGDGSVVAVGESVWAGWGGARFDESPLQLMLAVVSRCVINHARTRRKTVSTYISRFRA